MTLVIALSVYSGSVRYISNVNPKPLSLSIGTESILFHAPVALASSFFPFLYPPLSPTVILPLPFFIVNYYHLLSFLSFLVDKFHTNTFLAVVLSAVVTMRPSIFLFHLTISWIQGTQLDFAIRRMNEYRAKMHHHHNTYVIFDHII